MAMISLGQDCPAAEMVQDGKISGINLIAKPPDGFGKEIRGLPIPLGTGPPVRDIAEVSAARGVS